MGGVVVANYVSILEALLALSLKKKLHLFSNLNQ